MFPRLPRRVCPACRTIDPPTEPAYGCPECGEGDTLSALGGEVPEVCPWCGEGKLELVTEHACAECGHGEVEEREVYTCPYCGEIRLSKYEYHPCPKRPRISWYFWRFMVSESTRAKRAWGNLRASSCSAR